MRKEIKSSVNTVKINENPERQSLPDLQSLFILRSMDNNRKSACCTEVHPNKTSQG